MHGTSFKDNNEIYCEICDLKNSEKNISHRKSRNFDRNFNFFIENVNFCSETFVYTFKSAIFAIKITIPELVCSLVSTLFSRKRAILMKILNLSTENIDFCPEIVHLNFKEGHLSTQKVY